MYTTMETFISPFVSLHKKMFAIQKVVRTFISPDATFFFNVFNGEDFEAYVINEETKEVIYNYDCLEPENLLNDMNEVASGVYSYLVDREYTDTKTDAETLQKVLLIFKDAGIII